MKHPRIDQFCEHRPNLAFALRRFIDCAERHERVTSWKSFLAFKPIQGERLQLQMQRVDKYSTASIKAAFSAARQFFRELMLEELVAANPLREVTVRGGRNIPNWNVLPSNGTSEQLLKMVSGSNEKRDRAILTILLDHGFRASTVCSMRWGDVAEREDGSFILTYVTKRGKQATVKLKPRTVEALKAHARVRMQKDHPLICASKTGVHALNRFQVYRIVRRWTKKLGLRVTPHGLRATFISDVIRRKGIEVARQLADHSNIETTVGYSRWVEKSDE